MLRAVRRERLKSTGQASNPLKVVILHESHDLREWMDGKQLLVSQSSGTLWDCKARAMFFHSLGNRHVFKSKYFSKFCKWPLTMSNFSLKTMHSYGNQDG